MGMRIWHQSFTVLSDLGAYDEALKKHFRDVARPDTEIVMHGMRPGTYRSNYPGDDIRHVALQHLHSIQFVQAGWQAQKQGFDAYAISTLPDPALREIRGLLDIPVVGYGESAMLEARRIGKRFSVLVFIPELVDQIRDNAQRYGFGAQLADVAHVGFQFGDVLKGFTDPAQLIDRFRAAVRAQIAKGAEVIIPGEAPLCVLLARNGISEVDGVPIVDSLACWIKMAEGMVELKRQGMAPQRKGYFEELPAPDRVEEILRFYGLADSK
jgi:Asp/Glu/hydantoin racemase